MTSDGGMAYLGSSLLAVLSLKCKLKLVIRIAILATKDILLYLRSGLTPHLRQVSLSFPFLSLFCFPLVCLLIKRETWSKSTQGETSGIIQNTIQHDTIQYNTTRYNTIQYNTIQYNTIQHDTIQYNTT